MASTADVLPLWPAAPPTDAARTATLTLYPAASPVRGGATVLVLPGGGYENLADHEGGPVAERLVDQGFDAAVLHYRLGPASRHPAMLHDVQRGVRLLRARAGARGVPGTRIAVLGFSAGGHLASTVAVLGDDLSSPDDDLRRAHSARPDAVVLCYPVIDLGGRWAHAGSRVALLGDVTDDVAAPFSTQHAVTSETPPAFLWHTADDELVPVEGSLEFAAACRRHGVPVELHVYESARHGLGLAEDLPDVRTWFEHGVRFLERHLTA